MNSVSSTCTQRFSSKQHRRSRKARKHPIKGLQQVLLIAVQVFLYWLLMIVAVNPTALAAPTSTTNGLPTQIQEIELRDRQGNLTTVQTLVPDWSSISFSDLPPIQQRGSIRIGDQQRTWQAGQALDQVLHLGDLSDLRVDRLTLDAISQRTNADINTILLSQFPLVGKQTLGDLAAIVPALKEFQIQAVTPIQAAVEKAIGTINGNETLAQLLSQHPNLATTTLNTVDQSRYPLNAIPNLGQVELGEFRSWIETQIASVPGLGDLSLTDFPTEIADIGNLFARIDAAYSPAEGSGGTKRTVSGSYQAGFSVGCKKDCAYIELDDLENSGRRVRGSFEGKQWVSGKYQEVEGGEGCLQWANGGKEPTGRHSFGPAFKVVVLEPSETADTVSTALYFRFKAKCGATPYFIGPVPFFTYKVGMPIFIGRPNWQGASRGYSESTGAKVEDAVPIKGFSDPGFGGDDGDEEESLTLCSGKVVQGVSLDVLAGAIQSIESRGSGGYSAVGTYGCDGAGLCGRGLGKYQFMNYNEYATTRITTRPGGQAFLDRVRKGDRPTANDLARFFPPEDQDTAFQGSLADKLKTTAKQIDLKTGKPFVGDRLIERVAQKHFAGDYSAVDGGGGDDLGTSTYGYGVKARSNYGQSSKAKCQEPSVGNKLVTAGSLNAKIANASASAYGMDTSAGPKGGREACAWSVNRVLGKAGIQPVGANPDYVPSVAADLKAGRGVRVSPSQAKAGDIILAKGYEHIGICQNDGCSQVLSNSSSRASFRWKSDRTFNGYYNNSAYIREAPTEEIYRVVK
ncbi:M23 family peptidase [Leptolyngbyaceae cyanobacterium UHCC 1019]